MDEAFDELAVTNAESAPEASRQEKLEARQRRLAIVPQVSHYERLEEVLWPFVTVTATPNYSSAVVSTDSRGHRITRVGSETARSDDAPANAGFVLGGSTAFGYGATDDSGTLSAALWRRTGIPYVNLGINAGNSTQEVVSALPFADRPATFVVFSGLNNLMRARGDGGGLDPLFGYLFGDRHLVAVSSLPLSRLARLVRNPLASTDEATLYAEARRRLAKRMGKRLGSRWSRGSKRPRAAVAERPPRQLRAADEVVATASAQQLRDLRILRRMVPDEATVVFALQPHAFMSERQLSPEEEEIFAAIELIRGSKSKTIRDHIRAYWGDYAAALERGCTELGVPFLDVANADLDRWCFVDPAHMTDRGYDAVAAMLEAVVPHADRSAVS